MAKARLTADWKRTAALLAIFYNANRGKGQPPKSADAFNPMAEKPRPRELSVDETEKLLNTIIEHTRR